jgi:hypothetical protein
MNGAMRQCLGCQEWKLLTTCYPIDAKSGGGYRARCGACMAAEKRTRRAIANPKRDTTPFCAAAVMKAWRGPVNREAVLRWAA